jgi:hypothetical protein
MQPQVTDISGSMIHPGRDELGFPKPFEDPEFLETTGLIRFGLKRNTPGKWLRSSRPIGEPVVDRSHAYPLIEGRQTRSHDRISHNETRPDGTGLNRTFGRPKQIVPEAVGRPPASLPRGELAAADYSRSVGYGADFLLPVFSNYRSLIPA